MAVWMELRCDWRCCKESEVRRACNSHVNAGPMEMSSNAAAHINQTRADLFQWGRKGRWKKYGQNWACPECAAQIDAGNLPRDPDAD